MRKIINLVGLILFCISCNRSYPEAVGDEVKGLHENGNISYQYHTVDGKRHGVYKEYYPSGKIQIRRSYNMDTIVSEKIIDINDKILVNYVIRDGRYYGLLGSSSCMSVFNENKEPVQN